MSFYIKDQCMWLIEIMVELGKKPNVVHTFTKHVI